MTGSVSPPELAGFAEVAVSDLTVYRALNGATADVTDGLTITATAPPWSYILMLPVPVVHDDGLYAAQVDGRVLAGSVSLGIVLTDGASISQERVLAADERGPWCIAAGALRDCRAVLVRTVLDPPTASTIRIDSVRWWRSSLGCDELYRTAARSTLEPLAHWNRYYGAHGNVMEQLRNRCYDELQSEIEIPWLFGFRVVVFPREQMSRAVFVSGLYEPATMLAMRRLIPHGAVVIDGGANAGLMSLACSAWVGPQGRVLAFEPSSREYMRLVEHLRRNRVANVTARRSALGATEGRDVLHVADAQYSGLNTLGSRFGYDGIVTAGHETVDVTTIDAMVGAEALSRVDLIKLDVEGAEHDVLEGSRDTIGRFRPAMVFEANAAALAAHGRTLAEVEHLVRSFGYRFFAIDDAGELRPRANLDSTAENYVALPGQSV
jgi:FkbM family methyltransferase